MIDLRLLIDLSLVSCRCFSFFVEPPDVVEAIKRVEPYQGHHDDSDDLDGCHTLLKKTAAKFRNLPDATFILNVFRFILSIFYFILRQLTENKIT